MKILEPRVTTVPAFKVTGVAVRTKNEDEFNPKTAKLPGLWEKFRTVAAEDEISYGVYSNYDSDSMGFYTVTAGNELQSDAHSQSVSTTQVQAGTYLVFENHGPMPQAIIETWQSIWSYFQSNPTVIRSYLSDFEKYLGIDKCEVYIGISAT